MWVHAVLAFRNPKCSLAKRCNIWQTCFIFPVNVLAKTVDPHGYNDGRPMCVLPVLYHAWTSVFCQQLLKKWALFLSTASEEMGAALAIRPVWGHPWKVRQGNHMRSPISCAEDTPLSEKCFNALPRAPLRELMCHWGPFRRVSPGVGMWREGTGGEPISKIFVRSDTSVTAEGHQRLSKLAAQPRSLACETRLIQSAIWPASFYSFALGQKHVCALRSAFAKVLVRNQKQISPFFGIGCFGARTARPGGLGGSQLSYRPRYWAQSASQKK